MSSGLAGELRSLLHQARPCFLMQVHDGISTKIAQKAGFRGLWASSFGCSTALGLPDDDSMSPEEVLNYLRPILRSCNIPVLVDGNCGCSSLEETQAFLTSLIELGAAGVCFEDKQYPKENTFYSPSHPLTQEECYCELVETACRSRVTADLTIIARTEALVVGEEIDAVIRRCDSYCKAGAEAVFVSWIHEDVTQLRLFIEAWNRRAPILINPTAYFSSLPSLLALSGVSVVVWANQNIRACVKAMSSICSVLLDIEIANPEFLTQVDLKMSSMADIFELIGYTKR